MVAVGELEHVVEAHDVERQSKRPSSLSPLTAAETTRVGSSCVAALDHGGGDSCALLRHLRFAEDIPRCRWTR